MEVLYIYTIYDHPLDYPSTYVIRRDSILAGQAVRDPDYNFENPDLAICREEMMKMGLTCLNRQQDDDPVILESWI